METIFMPFRRLALTYGDFYGDPHNEVEHVGSAKASKIAPPGSEPAGAHSKNGLSSRDTRGDHQPAWSERTKTSSTLLSCGGPHKYLKPAIIDSTELLTASTRAPSTTEARVAYLTPKLRSKSDSSAIRPTSSINDTFVASEPIPFPKLRSKSDSFSYRPTSDFSEGGTSLSNDYHLSERIRAMDNGTLKRSKSQNAIHPPSDIMLDKVLGAGKADPFKFSKLSTSRRSFSNDGELSLATRILLNLPIEDYEMAIDTSETMAFDEKHPQPAIVSSTSIEVSNLHEHEYVEYDQETANMFEIDLTVSSESAAAPPPSPIVNDFNRDSSNTANWSRPPQRRIIKAARRAHRARTLLADGSGSEGELATENYLTQNISVGDVTASKADESQVNQPHPVTKTSIALLSDALMDGTMAEAAWARTCMFIIRELVCRSRNPWAGTFWYSGEEEYLLELTGKCVTRPLNPVAINLNPFLYEFTFHTRRNVGPFHFAAMWDIAARSVYRGEIYLTKGDRTDVKKGHRNCHKHFDEVRAEGLPRSRLSNMTLADEV